MTEYKRRDKKLGELTRGDVLDLVCKILSVIDLQGEFRKGYLDIAVRNVIDWIDERQTHTFDGRELKDMSVFELEDAKKAIDTIIGGVLH